MRDEVERLAEKIRNGSEWNKDQLAQLCSLAGMEEEWEQADGENFEEVAFEAAERLGVEIV